MGIRVGQQTATICRILFLYLSLYSPGHVVMPVDLLRALPQGAAHDQPHHQFDAFAAGLAHIFGVGEGFQAVRVGGQVERQSVIQNDFRVDPDIGIDWPTLNPILSSGDQVAPRLADCRAADLPVYSK